MATKSTAQSAPREYRAMDLKWRGRELRLSSGRLLATTAPDGRFVGPANGHVQHQQGQRRDDITGPR